MCFPMEAVLFMSKGHISDSRNFLHLSIHYFNFHNLPPLPEETTFDRIMPSLGSYIVDRKNAKLIDIKDFSFSKKQFRDFVRGEDSFYFSDIPDYYYSQTDYENIIVKKCILPSMKEEFVREVPKEKYFESSGFEDFRVSPDGESIIWKFYHTDYQTPPKPPWYQSLFSFFLFPMHYPIWIMTQINLKEENKDKPEAPEINLDETEIKRDDKMIILYKDNPPIHIRNLHLYSLDWIDNDNVVYNDDWRIFVYNLQTGRSTELILPWNILTSATSFKNGNALIYSSNLDCSKKPDEPQDEEYKDKLYIYNTTEGDMTEYSVKEAIKGSPIAYDDEYISTKISENTEYYYEENVTFSKFNGKTGELTASFAIDKLREISCDSKLFFRKIPDKEETYLISTINEAKFCEEKLLLFKVEERERIVILDTFYKDEKPE